MSYNIRRFVLGFLSLFLLTNCGTVYRDIDSDTTYLVRGIIMLEYNPGPPCTVKVFVDGFTHEYIGHFGCGTRSIEVVNPRLPKDFY